MAEKIVFELEVSGNGAIQAGTSLKKQLREAKEEAQKTAIALGATSKEAIAAAQKVAGMQEELNDVKDTINALHPEQKLNAVVGAVQGIAGGFAAAEGAMALFGAESEDVQKQMVKIQGALALSQGINSVMALGDQFKNLQIMLKSTAAFQVVYNFVTQASTVGMKLFRAALISTGLGAFAVGLGLLIAHFEDLKKYIKENTEQVKLFAVFLSPVTALMYGTYKAVEALGEKFQFIGKILDIVKEKFGALWAIVREGLEAINVLDTAEENAADDHLDRVEERLEANESVYKSMQREIELMKAQGATAAEIREKEKAILDLRVKDYEAFIAAKVAADEELTQDEKDQLEELRNQREIAYLNDARLDKEEADKAAEARRERNRKAKEAADKEKEDRDRAAAEARDRELQLMRQYEDEVIKSMTDSYQRERQELIVSFDRRIQDIKGEGETEKNIRLQLEANKQQALDQLQDKYLADQAQKELDAIKLRYDNAQALLQAQLIQSKENSDEYFRLQMEIEDSQFKEKLETENLTNEQIELATAEHLQRKAEIEKAQADRDLKTQKEIAQAKLSIAENSVKAISSLGNLFIRDQQKLAAFNKSIAIIQLGIDTAKSISATIAAAAGAAANAGPAAPFVLGAYITSGIATVLGAFSQAKKILGDSGSVQTPSLGGGGGGGAPNVQFTSTQSPTTQLNKQALGSNDNPVIKAVVVETDITKSQERVKGITERSTF